MPAVHASAVLWCRDRVAIPSVETADTFASRALGLMGRAPLGAGRAIYLSPCRAIHTCFMRFALDLVFVDRAMRVVQIVRGVRPWRTASGGRAAHGGLELEAGWLGAEALREGDAVELREREKKDV